MLEVEFRVHCLSWYGCLKHLPAISQPISAQSPHMLLNPSIIFGPSVQMKAISPQWHLSSVILLFLQFFALIDDIYLHFGDDIDTNIFSIEDAK